MQNTSEIAECFNKLIGTIKSLEGHIDAIETENLLLESENKRLEHELVKVNATNPRQQNSSTSARQHLRDQLIVAVTPYVLTKTEVAVSKFTSYPLSDDQLNQAAVNIFNIVDLILKHR